MLVIFSNKPRITSNSVDMQYLRILPEHTVGKCYINFMDKYASVIDNCNLLYLFPAEFVSRQESSGAIWRQWVCHYYVAL